MQSYDCMINQSDVQSNIYFIDLAVVINGLLNSPSNEGTNTDAIILCVFGGIFAVIKSMMLSH